MLTLGEKSSQSIFSKISIKFGMLFLGFVAILWFVIRVIPKPSRASYPCQRAAFPLASAFIIWAIGSIISHSVYKKAKIAYGKRKHSIALVFMLLAMTIFTFSVFFIQIKDSVFAAINFATIEQKGEALYALEMASASESNIEPKATVSITRSEKAVATDVTFTDIDEMIRQAVAMAGGFDTLVHEGDLVVIKPNVIAGRAQNASFSNSFPDSANGIATDYRIIQVVVNMVREKNGTGKIIMIEGSGYGLTRKNIEAIGYTRITGIDSIICLEENISTWYDTNSSNLVKVSLPEGKNLYSATNKYYLHKIYYNADVLISLPCLKSHFLTGITGGVKNVGIGATPVEMYGNGISVPEDDLPGRWNHIDHGDFSTQTIPLDKWIHDFYMCRPVDYVIMDGIQGVQYGPYPGSNTTHTLSSVQKNLRVILAGKDPLAVDAVEALIAGFDPYKVGHLVLLAGDTVGCINPSFIKIKGAQVHEIKTPFGEDNPGYKCRYTDFTAPCNVTLTSCIIDNSEIRVSLNTGDEIVKVELAYNDTILDPIVVSQFTDITIPFDKVNADPEKVSVLLYDKYLNCTKLTLQDPSRLSEIKNEVENEIKVFPNPINTILNISLPDSYLGLCTISFFSTDGKLILSEKLIYSGIQQLDISEFNKGQYFININYKRTEYITRFTKI